MSLIMFPSHSFIVHILVFLLFAGIAFGHMVMSEPPPIQYKTNPYYDPSKGDFDYTAPLAPSGSNYPCRGHLQYLGTPLARSVRTYNPGGTYQIAFDGSAPHAGGSCQLSLSYDRGATWKVFKSFIGGCPNPNPAPPNSFTFKIPDDCPHGEALFAWTWFNNLGNREMYMNCAVVTIGGSSPRRLAKRQMAGPDMFIANIGNGCSTVPSKDLIFPQPGSQIEYHGDAGNRAGPVGQCQAKVYTPPPPIEGPGGTGGGGGVGGVASTHSAALPKPSNGGTLGGPGSGQNLHKGDCRYWLTQGYICSDANGLRFSLGRRLQIALVLLSFAFFVLSW